LVTDAEASNAAAGHLAALRPHALAVVDALIGGLRRQRLETPHVRIVVERVPGAVQKDREAFHDSFLCPLTDARRPQPRWRGLQVIASAPNDQNGISSSRSPRLPPPAIAGWRAAGRLAPKSVSLPPAKSPPLPPPARSSMVSAELKPCSTTSVEYFS